MNQRASFHSLCLSSTGQQTICMHIFRSPRIKWLLLLMGSLRRQTRNPNVVLFWIGWEMRHFLSITTYHSVMSKRRILKHFWMDSWLILSLNRIFTSHGTLLDLSTVDNSSHKVIFTTNYSKLCMSVPSLMQMRLWNFYFWPTTRISMFMRTYSKRWRKPLH